MSLVIVAAAILKDGTGRILLGQRPNHGSMAGLWELPGGKLETGESPEAALCRELTEELAIRVTPDALKPMIFASHAYTDFHLLMPVFVCDTWAGTPQACVHQALHWVAPEDLGTYDMPLADKPVMDHIMIMAASA